MKMNEIDIRFELNGEQRTATVLPHQLLVDFLRETLGLMGTKRSCDVEVCGSCTVLLNGRPVSGCTTLVPEINGRSLLTIEGLGRDNELHTVQEAFWEEGGFECGFCTPGMILATCALLDDNPDPSEDEIKAALDGNICRCTGYLAIIRSVKRAAQRMANADTAATPLDDRRLDGRSKVRGEPVYTADLKRPGMVYGRILRSPHTHARIVSIDTRAAESHPGVVTVLTAADLEDISPYYGPLVKDIPVLAIDKVRYEGDPVAAVAAETVEIAEEALAMIQVTYEPLKPLLNMDEALDPKAEPLHETVSQHGSKFPGYPEVDEEAKKYANVSFHYRRSQGDVAAGFAASHQIFEHTFHFPKVSHYSMEPQLAVAEWQDEGVTIWGSTQHPFIIRQEIAEMFDIPEERVRFIVPLVGGTYGNKNHTKLEPLTVALARKARRPVFLHLSMDDESRTVSKPAVRVTLKTGVSQDGLLIARQCLAHVDSGAYSDSGPRVTQKVGYRAPGPYKIPNLESDAYTVYTNTVPAGAFRGMGTPQVVWAYESQMDMIAHAMGWDPLEFRLKNLLEKNEDFAPGETPLDCDLRKGLLRVAEEIGWRKDPLPPDCGIGFACGLKDGGGNYKISCARVEIDHNGRITLEEGTVEVGQGSHTTMCRIAAQELGVKPTAIRIAMLDTDRTPFDMGTYASSGTTVMGLAVQRAAQAARAALIEAARSLSKNPGADALVKNGEVRIGELAFPFATLVEHAKGPGGVLIGEGRQESERDPNAPLGARAPFWEVGWGAAKVHVDRETGEVRVLKYVSIADAGKAINPQQCHTQEQGAFVQGLGQALFEETVYENGVMLTPDALTYRLPKAEDLPDELVNIIFEDGNGQGPYGAKGLGESGILPVPSAIANAVYQAVGVRITDLPITGEKIWRALQAAKSDPT